MYFNWCICLHYIVEGFQFCLCVFIVNYFLPQRCDFVLILWDSLVISLQTGPFSQTILLLNFNWHLHLTHRQEMMKWDAYQWDTLQNWTPDIPTLQSSFSLIWAGTGYLSNPWGQNIQSFSVFCYIKGTSCLKQFWPGSYSDCAIRISIKPNRCRKLKSSKTAK